MEKSGCVLLTQFQLDLINEGYWPDNLSHEEALNARDVVELKAIIDSGQYRIVEQN